MEIDDIYLGVANLINGLIKTEFRAQGHTLTGHWEESLTYKVEKTQRTSRLIGQGLDYGLLVNRGYTPSQVSMKMFPGLVEYFVKRGLSLALAQRAAGATIAKWKKEGMSTQASKRFSSTGARQNFIEAAFIGNDHIIDEFMTGLFDFAIDQKYHQVKNETI